MSFTVHCTPMRPHCQCLVGNSTQPYLFHRLPMPTGVSMLPLFSLLTILFPMTPFDGLADLVHTFVTVDLQHRSASRTAVSDDDARGKQGETVPNVTGPSTRNNLTWHVSNVQARFPGLMEVRRITCPGRPLPRCLTSRSSNLHV